MFIPNSTKKNDTSPDSSISIFKHQLLFFVLNFSLKIDIFSALLLSIWKENSKFGFLFFLISISGLLFIHGDNEEKDFSSFFSFSILLFFSFKLLLILLLLLLLLLLSGPNDNNLF